MPYLAPHTGTEQRLVRIWQDVLGVERVGVRDPIIDPGGHSLAATQICSRVRQAFGRRVPLAGPTLTTRSGPTCQLSAAQQRLWLADRLRPGSTDYNLFKAYRLRGPLDADVLRQAFADTIDRHAALRTTFHARGGVPYQCTAEQIPTPFAFLDLTGLLRLGARDHIAHVAIHHIVADDRSLSVFWRDICARYRERSTGIPAGLPPLPIRYVDHAAWQREVLHGAALDRHLAHRRTELAGAPLVLEIPTDLRRSERRESVDAIVDFGATMARLSTLVRQRAGR